MADDQETPNDVGEEVPDYDTNYSNDGVDSNDITTTTTTTPAPIIDNEANPAGEDYEEDLPDVTVKLYVNVDPDGPIIPNDLVNAGITDMYGNIIPQATPSWRDSVDGYTGAITQGMYDGLNGTDTRGKGWLGDWTWNKALVVGFIGLCIIGIIVALLFMIIGKKFKKNKRAQAAPTSSTTTTTGAGVTKGISPKSEYSPVPTNV